MKTDKYSYMLSAFYCDIDLAHNYPEEHSMDKMIHEKSERFLKDLDLLGELEYLLRRGRAEIHVGFKKEIDKEKLIKWIAEKTESSFLYMDGDYATGFREALTLIEEGIEKCEFEGE